MCAKIKKSVGFLTFFNNYFLYDVHFSPFFTISLYGMIFQIHISPTSSIFRVTFLIFVKKYDSI